LKDQNFEWFVGADVVVDRIQTIVNDRHSHRLRGDDDDDVDDRPLTLLDVGCGTSRVFPTLFRQSKFPLRLICVDFCDEALETLKRESLSGDIAESRVADDELDEEATIGGCSHRLNSTLEFVRADMKVLPLSDASVDLILDKGATDAVLRARRDGVLDFRRSFREFLRVLRRYHIGRILHISDEDPDVRLQFLRDQLRTIFDEDNVEDAHDEKLAISFEAVEVQGREIFCYSIFVNS